MFITRSKRSPFYFLVFLENGKRKQISTKTTDPIEAQKFLEKYSQPEIETEEIFTSISLQKFCDEYSSHIELTKSKDYVRSIKLSFKMLIEFTGDIPINSLSLRSLDKFFTVTFARTQRGALLYYRTLKAAFSTAIVWGFIQENPLKKIKMSKPSKTFPCFISLDELDKILKQTNESFLRDLFITAFYTGMRLGELVNMKWSWIDFNQKQITVHCSVHFTTKSKMERVIPFNQNLKTILINRMPKNYDIVSDDFVFSDSRKNKLNEAYVSKKFKEYVRAAKLNEKIHFHTLRHSFASLLVQRGVSLYVVKELLGHEALSTTQIYSHLQQQNLRDAVNLL